MICEMNIFYLIKILVTESQLTQVRFKFKFTLLKYTFQKDGFQENGEAYGLLGYQEDHFPYDKAKP